MRLIDADSLRDAYINKMSEIYKNVASMKNVEAETVSVLCGYSVIDEALTVDAVLLKHGKWLTRSNPNYSPFDPCSSEEIHICNQCGYEQEFEAFYCPNCGAKMDVEIP